MKSSDRKEIAQKRQTAVERAQSAGLSLDPANIPELFYSDLMDDVRRVVRSGATKDERGHHVPSQATRLLVEAWSAVGTPQDVMAKELGIKTETLRRHYPDELSNGADLANQRVALRLFEKAMRGDNGCMMYWLSRRAGWSEKQAGDSEDNPLHVKAEHAVDVSAIAARLRASKRGGAIEGQAVEITGENGGTPGGQGGTEMRGGGGVGTLPAPENFQKNEACNLDLHNIQDAEYAEVQGSKDRGSEDTELGGYGKDLL